MNDRFTDRAQKVMQLANQEAQRFNHEYIGTEHILLGLIKEATGVAAAVLGNFRVDTRKIRIEVEKLMRSGPDPNPSTMGELPQTPRARRVIEYSMEEARNLNHGFTGTEHILLGLLREQDGAAAQVLMGLGLKLEEVREEVLRLLGCEENSVEKAMEKTPFHKVEAELDRAENADKHVGDSVSTDAPIRYSSVRQGKETGDVTLTDAPPEEPLGVPFVCAIEPMSPLADAIGRLAENSPEDVDAKSLVAERLEYARKHIGNQNETIKNLQETIRVMRAENTKMRDANKAATIKCHCGEAWPTPKADPQAEAQAAGLDAVEQVMEPQAEVGVYSPCKHCGSILLCRCCGPLPETETPTDADAS